MTEIHKKEFANETCKVEFSADELKEFSETLAQQLGALEEKETARKEVASQFKAEIDTVSNDCNSLAQKIRNKWEYRKVKCEVLRDFRKRTVTWIRTDTGEVHKSRAMTVDELQTVIDLEIENVAKENQKSDTDTDTGADESDE